MSSFHEGDKQPRRIHRPSGRLVSASGEGSLTRPRGDDGCTRAGVVSEEEDHRTDPSIVQFRNLGIPSESIPLGESLWHPHPPSQRYRPPTSSSSSSSAPASHMLHPSPPSSSMPPPFLLQNSNQSSSSHYSQRPPNRTNSTPTSFLSSHSSTTFPGHTSSNGSSILPNSSNTSSSSSSFQTRPHQRHLAAPSHSVSTSSSERGPSTPSTSTQEGRSIHLGDQGTDGEKRSHKQDARGRRADKKIWQWQEAGKGEDQLGGDDCPIEQTKQRSSRSDSHLPNATFSNPPVRPPVFASPFDLYSTSSSQNPFLRPPSPPEATGPIPKRHLSNSPPETRDRVVVDAESSAHQVTSRSLPADADGGGVEEGVGAEKDREWERENLLKMLKMAADWGDSTFHS